MGSIPTLGSMIDERFIFFGLMLNFIGTASYLIDTITGKVKPNKVSWFLWALAPMIAFAAEIKQGVGLAAWMTFAVGFSPLLIFLASFINRKSFWKMQQIDLICGALSILGIFLWYITKVGNIAILFSIMADGTAAIPTIIKSYKEPESESYSVFFLAAMSAFITLMTLKTWDFAHYGFPLYILLVCVLITVLVKFKIGEKVKLFAD